MPEPDQYVPFFSRRAAGLLSDPRNAMPTRAIGGMLGGYYAAKDHPEGVLGLLADIVKGAPQAAVEGIQGAMQEAPGTVYGTNRGEKNTELGFGLLGASSITSAPSAALRSGMSRASKLGGEPERMARASEWGDIGQDFYHATKQDIDEFVPGYNDGLVFLTNSPEFANDWLGKGKYKDRLGRQAEIERDAVADQNRALKEKIYDFESLNKLPPGDEFTKLYDAAAEEFRRQAPVTPYNIHNAIYPVRTNVQKVFDPSKDFKEIEDVLSDDIVSSGLHKSGNYLIYENKKVVDALKEKGYDAMWLAESQGGPMNTLAVFDPKNIRSKFAEFDPSKKDSSKILAANKGGKASGLLGLSAAGEDEIVRAARVSGIDEDAFAKLVEQGHMAPQIAPIGARGQELGFPTGYSGGLKVPVGLLQDLDAGLVTKKPRGAAKRRDLTADIEALEGKILVPMPGDRTSRDIVTQFMGEKIDPYQVHGGYDYIPDLGGWASGKGVISRYDKLFKELEGEGVGVATPMAGTGSDYAHAGIDMMYRTMDVDAIPTKTKASIKDEVNQWLNAAWTKEAKQKEKKGQPAPPKPKPFKGLNAEGKKQLYGDGLYRKAFMESIDKDRVTKLEGAPSAVALRHAITDDRFRYLRSGDPDPLSGQRFVGFSGKTDPTPVGLLNKFQHPTYDTHLSGTDLGGLLIPVPRTIMFPDFARKMEQQGRPLSQHNYMFDRMKPKQEMRPDVIEGILNFQRQITGGR